jgi:hypothetical protein
VAGYIDAMRSTLAELLGEEATETPYLPEGLSEPVREVASEAVFRLVEYQGPGYAALYLDRLRRFVGRRDVDDALLIEIARLMADRMCYDDPIRIAQSTLAEAGVKNKGPAALRIDRKLRFRIGEIVSALPEMVADPVLDVLDYLGWLHKPIKIRFNATSFLGIRRLKIEASLRRFRLLSVRYPKERAWVERWLHMIDRSLTKAPRAAAEIVQTATMVNGYGDHYQHGLADWNLVIDQLAKPVFDGALALPDLPAAIRQAREAARPDPRQTALKRAIAEIRAQASIAPKAAAE